MSSLLKALKQQQSPLVRQGSDIDPALLDRRRSKPWMTLVLGLIVLGLTCTVLVTVGLQWVTKRPSNSDSSRQAAAASDPYQLGQTLPVANVNWQADDKQQPTTRAAASTSKPVRTLTEADDSDQRQPLNLNQVSPELLEKFEQAVAQSTFTDSETATVERSVIPALKQLAPSFQRQVARFSYDGHMYVSDPQQRWIELNQQRLYRGDLFQGMRVEEIEPQRVILSLEGNAFSVGALQDWTGQ